MNEISGVGMEEYRAAWRRLESPISANIHIYVPSKGTRTYIPCGPGTLCSGGVVSNPSSVIDENTRWLIEIDD